MTQINSKKQGNITTLTISTDEIAAYVQVFPRHGDYLADLNFFDGNRTLEEIRLLHALLGATIEALESTQTENKTRYERAAEI